MRPLQAAGAPARSARSRRAHPAPLTGARRAGGGRRLKAAFAAFSEATLPELRQDKPGLKQSQYKEMIWKLWQKAPTNPLNRLPSGA
jgi:hypothetical protein